MTLLNAQEITVRFGGVIALDGLSFTIDEGHICGLIGPNGAGKSTTILMLTGMIEPTGGRCLVDGIEVVSSTNVFSDAITGVEINAVGESTPGSTKASRWCSSPRSSIGACSVRCFGRRPVADRLSLPEQSAVWVFGQSPAAAVQLLDLALVHLACHGTPPPLLATYCRRCQGLSDQGSSSTSVLPCCGIRPGSQLLHIRRGGKTRAPQDTQGR